MTDEPTIIRFNFMDTSVVLFTAEEVIVRKPQNRFNVFEHVARTPRRCYVGRHF